MTCSDASGHSNCSEIQPMIELDSPDHFPMTRRRLPSSIDFIAAEFDPLRPSTSHDSLLDSATQDRVLTTSPTLTPTHHHHQQQHQHRRSVEVLSDTTVLWGIGPTSLSSTGAKLQSQHHQPHHTSPASTSPKGVDISPKQSLTTSTSSSYHHYPSPPIPSPSIARPRPKSNKEVALQTISAPSSRPHSPKLGATGGMPMWDFKGHRFNATSPTGSVKSMRDLPFDTDFGGFYSDSNTTSANSSLVDLMGDVEEDTMVHLNFDTMFNTGFLSQQ